MAMKSVKNGAQKSPEHIVVVSRVNMSFYDRDLPTRALENVSFQVRQGEVLGLLGPKGAGKSTMLKLLAGQLKPAEGKVRVLGRSPKKRTVKAQVGFVPESLARAD